MLVPRSRGFTLIEMIISIVVIGIGLAGVLVSFNVAVRSSADPLISKQLVSIAEAEMEGIMLQDFTTLASTTTCASCPPGYGVNVVVTPGVLWEDIPNTATISVTAASGTQNFVLINHRTNYGP
ncbi:prepilin-type N-terminal cleavage/methylation domain-containing protein [Dechloromonas sp. HYN0024]|uniref:prepilin-type N-terminal cleavage/methylation domain-containing protein n=1 Tax=Dechloromonas sp. HYN0024 TaxID=2231055 RepID=UPI0013C2D538|nr:prepilin-type N-terminal cleavage/methylation domain-containing protein [Dechloromonas sp. HYN0024]